jgi:hypothetical protein
VPNLRTMVTELGSGLGMLGHDSIDGALAARSPVMRSLSPDDWDQLSSVRAGGAFDGEFHSAWENGRAFLAARDGLRGRLPQVLEWKGSVRATGDEVAPVDLRIDHVYLVSCKYLSDILFNVSPKHVFDDLLVGGQSRRGPGAGGDWFAEVAPVQYQRLYDVVRQSVRNGELGSGPEPGSGGAAREWGPLAGGGTPALPGLEAARQDRQAGNALVAGRTLAGLRELPTAALDLSSSHRAALGECLKAGWPGEAKSAYEDLSQQVAQASASRWRDALSATAGAGSFMLWRLLRMGSAPYFVLGSSATRSLRLRIATPWDWRQFFSLVRFEITPQEGGQPRVGWSAEVLERSSGLHQRISGHVEIRWSHGRFGGAPEAKGYIDTPHHLVPGYFPLQ